MAELSDFLESALVQHVIGEASYTAPATIYASLYTVAPTDAGGGTEVSGNGYARQAITWAAESGGAASNSAAITFSASGGNFGTVVATGMHDALTVGNLLAHDAGFADTAVDDGDDLEFAIGDWTFSLD